MEEDERDSAPEAPDGGEGDEAENLTPNPWADLAKSIKFDMPSVSKAILPELPSPIRPKLLDLLSEPLNIPKNPIYATNELLERMIKAAVEAEEETRIERERAHRGRVLNGWLTGVGAAAALAAAVFTAVSLWG